MEVDIHNCRIIQLCCVRRGNKFDELSFGMVLVSVRHNPKHHTHPPSSVVATLVCCLNSHHQWFCKQLELLLSASVTDMYTSYLCVKNLFPSKIQAACSLLARRLSIGSAQHRCLICNKRDITALLQRQSLIKRERAKQYNNNLYKKARH